MNDNSIWFGRAGALRKLWAPTGGTLATRDRDTSIFTNKVGGTRVTRALDGARQYVLQYAALGRASFEYLNQFQQGHMGPGPFVLIDPGRRNMLTVNQSSATSQTGDTRGFSPSAAGSSLASSASTWGGLPQVLTWSFSTSSPASPTLTLTKPSAVTGWYGIPVIPRPHTFWGTVVSSGGAITLALRIDWYGASGFLSSTTGPNFTTSTTAPQRVYVKNATPPSGALWALGVVAPDGTTIAAGESLQFLNFMLQEGADMDRDWVGGTGVYPVTFVGMPEKYGFDEPGMLVGPSVTLQEVR